MHYYYYQCTGKVRQDVCHGYSVHQVPFDRAVRRKVWELIEPVATAKKAKPRTMLIQALRKGQASDLLGDSQQVASGESSPGWSPNAPPWLTGSRSSVNGKQRGSLCLVQRDVSMRLA